MQTLARDGFEKLATDASEAGQIMENDVVRSMDETADKIEDTNTAFTILIAEILVPIVDILTLVSQGWGLVKDSIVAAIEQAADSRNSSWGFDWERSRSFRGINLEH